VQFREVKHARVWGRSGEGRWIVVQGSRASACETAGRVAAGAVAKKLLAVDVKVEACVMELGGINAEISPQGL
jgi:chorismate synthase